MTAWRSGRIKHKSWPFSMSQVRTSLERPQIHLVEPGRVESEVARDIGRALGELNVLFRRDEEIVELVNEPFDGELDRFKLAKGGPKFGVMTPIRFKTWVEQFVSTGTRVENKKTGVHFLYQRP
jgi:hypothetical protein